MCIREREKIDALFQAGRYTATAKNNQSSHFILVQQELSTLKELVWNHIDALTDVPATELPKEYIPFVSFNRHRKADPTDDFLFRNAPAVLYITSDWDLDAGLAAQNIEHMAIAQGLGALYNGYLQRISDENEALKTLSLIHILTMQLRKESTVLCRFERWRRKFRRIISSRLQQMAEI